MNLDNLNKWLAVGANVGVLIGIIFLAAEINQSNRVATGTTEGEIRERYITISSAVIDNPGLARTWAKLESPEPDLDSVEVRQVNSYARNHWLFFVSVEEAFNNDLISEDTFEVYLGVLNGVLSGSPGFSPFSVSFLIDKQELEDHACRA